MKALTTIVELSKYLNKNYNKITSKIMDNIQKLNHNYTKTVNF